jgi:hypothetical protein
MRSEAKGSVWVSVGGVVYAYACTCSEGWGGETNQEIDFGFGSYVRARGLVVRWE